MKIIQSGNTLHVHSGPYLRTYDLIPPQTYEINYNKNEGFYLSEHSSLKPTEKIYGIHQQKVNKALAAFGSMKRNLGILLTGEKGIGKTFFTKILAQTAMKENYPVLLVKTYYAGIASFINSIEQEIIVIFDEFDKTFNHDTYDRNDPSTELLTLFDGLSAGKKMFVITGNQEKRINEYFLNRPGRIHYHFKFTQLSKEEIEDYLHHELNLPNKNDIQEITDFAIRSPLTYDTLRAIVFELNCGNSFKEAIEDLNITQESNYYIVTLYFENNQILTSGKEYLNMASSEKRAISFEEPAGYDDIAYVSFIPSNIPWNSESKAFEGDRSHINTFDICASLSDEAASKYEKIYKKIKKITIKRDGGPKNK